MKIIMLSCEKNRDLQEIFIKCLDKYWENHPKLLIYENHDINNWSGELKEYLKKIKDNKVLIMCDDFFIREPVDTERIKYCDSRLKGDIAVFNFEKSFDSNDSLCGLNGFKKRSKDAFYKHSCQASLWNKSILMETLSDHLTPWTWEMQKDSSNYDFLINSGDYIINYGYKHDSWFGICKGKWCEEVIPFFEKENIEVDYEKRGFN